MGTSYQTIYNRFLLKITDYSLTELPDDVLSIMMLGYLKTSVAEAEVHAPREGVFEMDDDSGCFVHVLSNLEQEILALGCVEAWVEPQINSILLTQQMVGTKQTSLETAIDWLFYGALIMETLQCIPSYMLKSLVKLYH